MRTCKKCGQSNPLPANFQSNEHWIWEGKNDRKSGGIHLCRACRTKNKRASWNDFYNRKQLRCVVSRSITQKFKNRGLSKRGSILSALPYTIDELKSHLESQFEPGMSWDNYGQWHVDHIIPDSSFNYDKMSDIGFLSSWELNNLRPLWATENRKKYNKFIR